MSRHLDTGALKELTLTTNGTSCANLPPNWPTCGVRRINVSLDTLDPAKFAADHPLGPPAAGAGRDRGRQGRGPARQDQRRGAEGLQRGRAFPADSTGAPREGHDLTFIEVMPMGDGHDAGRLDQYWRLKDLRARAGRPLHPHRPGRTDRRPRPLCPAGGNRPEDRLHHAPDPQFLRKLQPRAADLHGRALHVPWAGRHGRPARAPARQPG